MIRLFTLKKISYAVLIVVFTFAFNEVKATNYYVSSLTGSNSFSGTLLQPFATLQKAADLTNPGDTVFAMSGTYSTTTDFTTILKITRSGTSSQPIVYKNYANHVPFIDFNVWNGILVSNGASFIVIEGFKIRGNNRNVNLNDALNQPTSCNNPTGSPSPLFNGNGIAVLGNNTVGRSHHIIIRNCEVYECGTGGISSIGCDYITVENNIVYNNSWYTRYGGSGISFLNSFHVDNNTSDYKMIIRNNIVYGNQLFVPWRNGNVCEGITDGNGIIYDDNRNSQVGGGAIPYSGKALIENNVSYRNGGRGIHSFKSDNADIRNNTTYKNCISPEIPDGEITVITGSNIKVYNNILYAREGRRASSASNFTNFTEDNNIIFNSSLKGYYNTNDILTDPLFADTTNNDFSLRANSPAINTGNNVAGNFSTKDILGVNRPQGSLPDIGAYEFAGIPNTAGNFTVGNIVALRVGDGVNTLNTNATAVDLIEYSSTGSITGLSVSLGNSISTSQNRIALSGDGTLGEGQLNLSSDGRYLSLAGYEGNVGADATTYYANEKVIARISYNKEVNYTTRIAAATLNRVVRSAVTANSDRYFITGTNLAGGNNTRFLPFGTPPTTTSTAFNGGVRSLKMFQSQVYYANNNLVGSLTPNPSSGNFAAVANFTGVNISGHNYQSFVLLDADGTASFNGTGYDLLFCADLNLGLVKFYWNGSTWVLAGTFNPTSASSISGGLQDITGRIVNGKPELFVVKGAVSNNNIISLVDNSSFTGSIANITPTVTNLATAGNNYMFRGVAFSPSQLVTLPIELTSFTASVSANNVLLRWVTASEVNSKEFVIERSEDGKVFTSVGIIPTKNAATGANYQFTDNNLAQGQFYYRLKFVDNDGSFDYSDIKAAKISLKEQVQLSIYPNPVQKVFSVQHPISIDNASFTIYSIDGRKISSYSIEKGVSVSELNASEWGSGQYILFYKDSKNVVSKSFIK